jgi:hypothetical protein
MVRREMALWKPKARVERPLMKLGGLIKPKWRKVAPPEGAKIVEMAPVDFLGKVPSPCGEGRTAFEDLAREECWSKSSIDFIMGKVERGEELEPPMLDYTRMFRGFPSHEGRHTAYVAYKLGVERMPVIVYGTPQSSGSEGDYVTVKYVHGTFLVGEYATTSYSGVIDYLRLKGVPDEIIEEYLPQIKTMAHGEVLKIPKHHSNSDKVERARELAKELLEKEDIIYKRIRENKFHIEEITEETDEYYYVTIAVWKKD